MSNQAKQPWILKDEIPKDTEGYHRINADLLRLGAFAALLQGASPQEMKEGSLAVVGDALSDIISGMGEDLDAHWNHHHEVLSRYEDLVYLTEGMNLTGKGKKGGKKK